MSRFKRKKKAAFPPCSPAVLTKTHQSGPRVALPAFCDTAPPKAAHLPAYVRALTSQACAARNHDSSIRARRTPRNVAGRLLSVS